MIVSSSVPDAVITLVHGTIPRLGPIRIFSKPQWIERESVFRATLTRYFAGNLLFNSFSWSGDNSHKARIEAAKELANILREQIAQYPSSPHFIVAHSHGGNVALYAANELDQGKSRAVDGVITLGTPFIHCMRRDAAFVSDCVLNCVCFGTPAWFLTACFARSFHEEIGGYTLFAIASFLTVLGIALFFTLFRYSVGHWIDAGRRFEKDLAAAPQYLMLCIRARRDEAKVWVNTMEWVCKTMFGEWQLDIVRPVLKVMGVLSNLEGKPGYESAKFVLRSSPRLQGVVAVPMMFFAIWLCGGAALSLVLLLLIGVGTAITISSPWGFGQSVALPWLVRVWIEDVPMSRSYPVEDPFEQLISLNISAGPQSSVADTSALKRIEASVTVSDWSYRTFSFHHSALYSDERVIGQISKWIQEHSVAVRGRQQKPA